MVVENRGDGEEYGVGGDGGDIVEVLAEPVNKVVVGNVAKVIGKGDSREIVDVL